MNYGLCGVGHCPELAVTIEFERANDIGQVPAVPVCPDHRPPQLHPELGRVVGQVLAMLFAPEKDDWAYREFAPKGYVAEVNYLRAEGYARVDDFIAEVESRCKPKWVYESGLWALSDAEQWCSECNAIRTVTDVGSTGGPDPWTMYVLECGHTEVPM